MKSMNKEQIDEYYCDVMNALYHTQKPTDEPYLTGQKECLEKIKGYNQENNEDDNGE